MGKSAFNMPGLNIRLVVPGVRPAARRARAVQPEAGLERVFSGGGGMLVPRTPQLWTRLGPMPGTQAGTYCPVRESSTQRLLVWSHDRQLAGTSGSSELLAPQPARRYGQHPRFPVSLRGLGSLAVQNVS
jgi:hypothetical protein